LRYPITVVHCTLARRPDAIAITTRMPGRNRRRSGSMTTRPGSPSWSSSSHTTSGAAVRAANVRFAHRKTRTAITIAVNSAPRIERILRKTWLYPTSSNQSQSV
jgi:hypothetical protein